MSGKRIFQSRSTRGKTTHAGSPTTLAVHPRYLCKVDSVRTNGMEISLDLLAYHLPEDLGHIIFVDELHIRSFASDSQNDGHAGEVTRNILVHIGAIEDRGTDNCDLDSGILLEVSYQQLHGKLVFDIG